MKTKYFGLVLLFSLVFLCACGGGGGGSGGGEANNGGGENANLQGQWFLGAEDIQGNHTWDGTITLDNTGAVTGGILNSSEGSSYTFTGGNLTIDATGKVTGSITDSDGITTQLTMQMDSSKNILAGEGNATGEDGVFIFIKKW